MEICLVTIMVPIQQKVKSLTEMEKWASHVEGNGPKNGKHGVHLGNGLTRIFIATGE